PAAPPPGLDLLGGELLDVHVLERDDAHALHEAAGAVHVPHPGVAQVELDVGAPTPVADGLRDLVREVEPPLGLDDVREHRADVLVLLVELELDVGLVALEILGAHDPAPYWPGRRPQPSRFSRTLAAFPMRSRR